MSLSYSVKVILSILFFFVPACVIHSQVAKSIHIEEYDKYRYQDKPISKSQSKYKIDLRNTLNSNSLDKKFVGFHAYWAGEKYLNYRYDLISDLIYFGFEIDAQDGSISNTRGYLDHPISNICKTTDTKLHISIILFGSPQITSFLSDTSKISNFIANLVYYNNENSFDGINLDFETLPYESSDQFVYFVQQLDKSFPTKEISIDIPAVDWSSSYSFEKLNPICDFYFLMGYDYYWSGSDNAGPVSPLRGGNINIEYSLNRYESNLIDKEKIVLGLPWYGRGWEVSDSSFQSKVIGSSEAVTYDYIKSNFTSANYSQKYESNYLSYLDNESWKEIWYDDSLAFSTKVSFALNRELAGVGVWALHYQNDNNQLWGAVEHSFKEVSVKEFERKNDGIVEYYDLQGRKVYNIEESFSKFILKILKVAGKIKSADGIYLER